jgi:hypothetical protein
VIVTMGSWGPLYAQGMSSAGRSAVLLRERLSTASTLDRGFFRTYLDEQRESFLPIGFDHHLDPPAHDHTNGPVPGPTSPRPALKKRSA